MHAGLQCTASHSQTHPTGSSPVLRPGSLQPLCTQPLWSACTCLLHTVQIFIALLHTHTCLCTLKASLYMPTDMHAPCVIQAGESKEARSWLLTVMLSALWFHVINTVTSTADTLHMPTASLRKLSTLSGLSLPDGLNRSALLGLMHGAMEPLLPLRHTHTKSKVADAGCTVSPDRQVPCSAQNRNSLPPSTEARGYQEPRSPGSHSSFPIPALLVLPSSTPMWLRLA